MELNGQALEAILTTNGSVSTLSTDVTKRVYGFDKNSSGIESVADGDGHTMAQYRSMELTPGGLTVVGEKIKLTDPTQQHLSIDQERRRYWLYGLPLSISPAARRRYIATTARVHRNERKLDVFHGQRGRIIHARNEIAQSLLGAVPSASSQTFIWVRGPSFPAVYEWGRG
jgi:hypothetical protein